MTVDQKFEALFAVPMTCEGCVKDVSDSLYKIAGISKVEANLKEQLVRVEGTGSAVSILETYAQLKEERDQVPDHQKNREVRGLARMVEVSKTVTLVDLTLRGVEPGTYRATIREYGNLAGGASSTGPVWKGDLTSQPDQKDQVRGELGNVEIGSDGRGSIFLDRPFQVWEVIGHAFVVTRQDETGGKALQNDENTVVGVIARSAGVWDNDKTVCSCTGKTLWEERKDEVKNGML
ncbi:putative heavy-metal-associated domain-containing protein [Diaporthe ampelina]|uniref:Superoxide dismutase 1 copper chaperone n=1 Tax=Diaporthe ampelina TaxID=1214573 RepID=A0A0G2FBC3_9PEZI|nr:putative heavy-metal-associated domain-containing protein [Diaporthe ampelina]